MGTAESEPRLGTNVESRTLRGIGALLVAAAIAGCAGGSDPATPSGGEDPPTRSAPDRLKIAAVDLQIADLATESDLSRYTRADIVVFHPWSFWDNASEAGVLDRLRAANPDIRILAYFSPKIVRGDWSTEPHDAHPYSYALWQAGVPYLCHTTTGDTVSDWPGAFLVDFTNPEMRSRRLDVLEQFQGVNGNTFDGVFWDNFAPDLWIGPGVTNMDGEPDMDGDGVAYRDDPDEIAAFRDAQVAWIHETRARFGEGFIQIANGTRASKELDFAELVDGAYQEVFPQVPYGQTEAFIRALNPAIPNNEWEILAHLRKRNGGPWLIPANITNVGGFYDQSGSYRRVDTGDINRVVALLTGATSAHFDLSGMYQTALPSVELDLGAPVGDTVINGSIMTREFANGTVRLQMEAGVYPVPFRFWIRDAEGRNVQVLDPPYAYP